MPLWLRILTRIFGRTRTYEIFTSTDRQTGACINGVAVFDRAAPLTGAVRDAFIRHSGRLISRMLLRRVARGEAVLLTMTEETELAAFGLLQTWPTQRREFWWLDRHGICLGPYWTNPAFRGRGLYGRLLEHSLFECGRRWPDLPLYIWADYRNESSIRGIVKAGFEPCGRHQVSVYAFNLVHRHRRIDVPHSSSDADV